MPLEISHLLNGSGNTKTTKEKNKSRSTHTTTASFDPLWRFAGKSWRLWLMVGVCRMFHDPCIYRYRFKRWLKYLFKKSLERSKWGQWHLHFLIRLHLTIVSHSMYWMQTPPLIVWHLVDSESHMNHSRFPTPSNCCSTKTCPSSIGWCDATRQKGIFQTHDHTLHHSGKQPHLSGEWGDRATRKPGHSNAPWGESIPRKPGKRGNFWANFRILIPIFMSTHKKLQQWMGELLKSSKCACFTNSLEVNIGISHLFEVAYFFPSGNPQSPGTRALFQVYHIYIWKWLK